MDRKGIAIACRMDSERALKLAKQIFELLVKKGELVYLETRIAPKIFPHSAKNLDEMSDKEVKFVISVGGDGTILRVAHSLPQNDSPPILGVNIGSIGFLDESHERTIFSDLDKVFAGEYILEECNKLDSYLVKGDEEIKLSSALNEILVVSSKNSKVLQVSISINGTFVNRTYLDGVIISTPTGSTAYNLSAGGSIISPNTQIMEITPLNSFARSGLRPIILPLDSLVEIKLLRPRLTSKIIIDGQQTIKRIQPNTIVRVCKSNSVTRLIRFTNNLYENYFKRLRMKIIGTVRTPIDDSPEE
ncbi:MAG TPA: NAD(+)/NADH kinase [Candidatus Lokiarchaeia archaeon]